MEPVRLSMGGGGFALIAIAVVAAALLAALVRKRASRDRPAVRAGAGGSASVPASPDAPEPHDPPRTAAAVPSAPLETHRVESDLMTPEHVFLTDGIGTRDDVLRFVADRAVELGLARDADALVAAFLKREDEGTTGMMDGFAIPHAKSSTVVETAVLVVRDSAGVSGWDTMDDLPVNVAIALLIPDGQAGTAHLKLLSRVAEALMDDDFRLRVKTAADAAAIAATVADRLG